MKRSRLDRCKVELALLRFSANLLGLAGRAGVESSCQLPVLVLPVFCLVARVAAVASVDNARDSYFALMNRSITPSTSSISMGMSGRTFLGL